MTKATETATTSQEEFSWCLSAALRVAHGPDDERVEGQVALSGNTRPRENRALRRRRQVSRSCLARQRRGIYDASLHLRGGVARFTQPDTIVPSVGNGQDFNRYTYVRNNPINFNDPTGHLPGMNPHTVVEERGYFAGIQAWVGDVGGAFGSCQRGCYDRHNDSIAHAAVFYRGDRFDDGKHNDGKLDGDIRRGDFQAIADNKHGNAAEVDQWAAGWLLGRDQYDGYGDNRGWYEKGAVGAIYNNADSISGGLGILAIIAYASCPVTAGAGCVVGAGLSTGSAIAGAVNVHRSCKDGVDGGCAVAVAASVVSASAAAGSVSATGRVTAARSSTVLNTYSEVRYAERTAQVFGASSNALSTGFGYGAEFVVGG